MIEKNSESMLNGKIDNIRLRLVLPMGQMVNNVFTGEVLHAAASDIFNSLKLSKSVQAWGA